MYIKLSYSWENVPGRSTVRSCVQNKTNQIVINQERNMPQMSILFCIGGLGDVDVCLIQGELT